MNALSDASQVAGPSVSQVAGPNQTGAGLPDGPVLIPRAGGATAADLIEMQRAANLELDRRQQQARVSSLTLRGAVLCMRDTLQGILADLWGNSAGSRPLSLKQLLLTQDRLLGLGLLLVMLAGLGLLVCLFWGPATRATAATS